MAENSTRERLILADIAIIEAMSPTIRTVKRTMQGHEDLQQFSGPQLPVAAVVGRLPVPIEHKAGRNGQVDQIKSALAVDIFVYFQENEEQDKQLSNMLDEMWRELYTNPTRSGLCLVTALTPNPDYSAWAPYVAFQLTCNHHYIHTPGGI